MENGATITLESSWALNTHESCEASFAVCGTEGGADMRGGLVLNTIRHGKQINIHPQLDAKGVAFYDGNKEKPKDLEAKQFYDALENGTTPCVTPEQAFTVSQILEGIYISAKTYRRGTIGSTDKVEHSTVIVRFWEDVVMLLKIPLFSIIYSQKHS